MAHVGLYAFRAVASLATTGFSLLYIKNKLQLLSRSQQYTYTLICFNFSSELGHNQEQLGIKSLLLRHDNFTLGQKQLIDLVQGFLQNNPVLVSANVLFLLVLLQRSGN